jgi:hypothetical protein
MCSFIEEPTLEPTLTLPKGGDSNRFEMADGRWGGGEEMTLGIMCWM